MIKRFNFTGRVKIKQKDVEISVNGLNTSSITFSCSLDLEDYNFQRGAEIFIDVYRGVYVRKRYSLGTIGSSVELIDQSLPEFGMMPSLNFQAFVVDTRPGYKKILGRSSSIFFPSGEIGDNRSALLPVGYDQEMKQIWRTDFENENPMLLLNPGVSGIMNELKHDSDFRHLVIPSVFKEVLLRLFVLNSLVDEDTEELQEKWASFIRDLGSCGEYLDILSNDSEEGSEIESRLNAVDKIVEVFSGKNFGSLLSNHGEVE